MATPKKKTTKKQIPATNEIPISKAEKINIDRLFEQALVRHKKEEADKKTKLFEPISVYNKRTYKIDKDNFEKVVLISGDGDYKKMVDYLIKKVNL